MPKDMFEALGYPTISPTTMTIQLADSSIKYPEGIVESLLVNVRGSYVVDCVYSSKFIWICKRTNPRSWSRDPSSHKCENPRYRMLWDTRSYRAQTMKCNKSSRTKTRTQNQIQPKVPFSTVDFSKVDSLYKCRSVSFYREASGLFTFWGCPRMKRNEKEDARLFLGGLQLGLHVIGASWRHACYHHVRLSGEDLQSFGDSPLAWHLSSPETRVRFKLENIRHQRWQNPLSETQAKTIWVSKIHLWSFVVGKTEWLDRDPNALGCWVYLAAPQVTKGNGRKMGSEKWKWFWKLLGFCRRAFRIELRTSENTLLFWYTKGLIPNPPIEAPWWRGICRVANLSQQNPGIEDRGGRKRLPWRRFPRVSLELPKCPRFLPLGSKFLTFAFHPL
jgi:hypothetical protein